MPGAATVSPGTEIGRYTVGSRLETLPGGERWTARDTVLERDVVLLVMPAQAPTTAAAVDAARRAAGIEAPQLVRILDVGSEGEHAYVAEDDVSDAQSYADLVGDHGLPAEEVRRITGEVATGVEAARTRGLHHLALTPTAVLITGDGRVKVRGMATTAALADLETEGEEASRADATAVVALAYAGLTATWPLAGDGGGIPAATRTGGALPAPSEVAVGVPGDLDTICRETLVDGAGPDSPGDLAAQIAPWSRMPLSGDGRPGDLDTPVSALPTDQAPAGASGDLTDPAGATVPVAGVGAGDPSGDGDPGNGDPDAAVHAAGTGDTVAVPVAGAATAAGGPSHVVEDDQPTAAIPHLAASPQASAPGAGDDATMVVEPGGTPGPAQAEGPRRPGQAAAAAAGVLGAAASSSKVVGERLGTFARSASERSRDAVADRRARRAALREDEETHQSLGAAPSTDEIEPPLPLLPVGSGEPPSRDQSRTALMVIGGALVVALLVACFGVTRIGSNTDLEAILGSDQTQPAATATSSPGQTDGGTASGDGEPFAILGAVGYDPAGDGVEHNAEAQRVYDGDPGTAWTTEGYDGEGLAGKPGVGISVDLGQTQTVSSVTLTLPTNSAATVYAGDQQTSEGTVIGQTNGRTGELTLTAPQPVQARIITVWFTDTSQDTDGRYRASVAEIVVR